MITAITISTKYDDLLKIILPQNYKFFEKWYIITHKDDNNTINVIKEYNFPNVDIMYFDFYANNKIFNKGGAVRMCQNYLLESDYNGNILLLDSDIYLPDNFDILLKNIEISPMILYGTEKRLDYYSYENFKNSKVDHNYNLCHQVVGYFQLYKHDPTLLYKESIDCSKCDWDFRKLFKNKIQIKNLIVSHLGKAGVNWKGRHDKTDFKI